ncbi:DinB family protein [Hymenobacter guriensis]|uniref:DinB family protein n=1 Tax=Hymenobacter guriensis TaxID=2793065 RepID=A0ABS0L098_9BACT|nr:DinB family protein [Hymenobacter guriensis]MBG8553488.1 DinB family protein [Hymenobacter guriensis]
MLPDTLRLLFRRDLNRVQQELTQYRDEETIWQVEKAIANSAGNLSLHLVGNLRTYIGAELGGVAYTRHRELEFSLKNVPRQELLEKVAETRDIVDESLRALPPERLAQEYPLLVFEQKTSTEYLLVHLATHLAYHLGQINYHRRLLDFTAP